MKLTAVIIDSRPGYLDRRGLSLLEVPLGRGTLLDETVAWAGALTPEPVSVLAPFAPTSSYGGLAARADLDEIVRALEPSDWVLLVDPRRFALRPPSAEAVAAAAADPRWVTHWLAFENTPDGTKECVQQDEGGRVNRIQRYYLDVTWPCSRGIVCSLVPVALLRLVADPDVSGLEPLRQAFAARSFPTRDVTLEGPVIDLSEEGGLLDLGERSVRDLAATSREPVWIGRGCRIDPSARILGPAVIQDGATIGRSVTIVGPAVIGAGAYLEAGAVVAQCIVAGRTTVSSGAVARHCFVAGAAPRTIDALGGAGEIVVDVSTSMAALESAPSAEPSQRTEPDALPRGRAPVFSLKRLLDASVALLALIVLSPLIVLLSLAVKLTSRGPAFYGSTREGRDGKEFRCWKFRTMVDGADRKQRALYRQNGCDGPQFKLDRDPRVTRVGRVLRATNLDELPQLWNVLVGDMSLVGPRPSPFRENQICVPWRIARLTVRPGITGLWQVCRHERSCGDFHQWIYYDTLYVRRLSLGLDLKILAATLLTAGGKWPVPLSVIVPGSAVE